MTYVPDVILDLPLEAIAAGNALVLCSAEPANFDQATDTYILASAAAPSFSAPADASPNGRKITVAAVTSGTTVLGTGTATHWAIVNDIDESLLATKALSSPVALLEGAEFTLSAFDIRMPDPT